MKRLGPANQARKSNKTCAWNAENTSKPFIIPALRVVPTVVAHSAAATYALENAFKMARIRPDQPDRAAAKKELFRMHHQRYRFSDQQLQTLSFQTNSSNPTTLSTKEYSI